jgi:hypothetical protein
MSKSVLRNKLPAALLLFAAVLACKSIQSPDKPTILTSPDGKFQLSVPDGWTKTTDLHDKADIQAANKSKAMFVIVLIENQEDLAKDMTLDEFTDISRKSLMSKYRSPEATALESVSINGNDAKQYELKGTKDAAAVDLIVTTVKTPANYTQILAWTLPSKMSDNKETLKKVTESFREVPK